MGEIADDTSLPVLRKYESDTDANVRENVVGAIRKIQQSDAVGN